MASRRIDCLERRDAAQCGPLPAPARERSKAFAAIAIRLLREAGYSRADEAALTHVTQNDLWGNE